MVRRFTATTGSATETPSTGCTGSMGRGCSMVAVLMVFPPVVSSLTTTVRNDQPAGQRTQTTIDVTLCPPVASQVSTHQPSQPLRRVVGCWECPPNQLRPICSAMLGIRSQASSRATFDVEGVEVRTSERVVGADAECPTDRVGDDRDVARHDLDDDAKTGETDDRSCCRRLGLVEEREVAGEAQVAFVSSSDDGQPRHRACGATTRFPARNSSGSTRRACSLRPMHRSSIVSGAPS